MKIIILTLIEKHHTWKFEIPNYQTLAEYIQKIIIKRYHSNFYRSLINKKPKKPRHYKNLVDQVNVENYQELIHEYNFDLDSFFVYTLLQKSIKNPNLAISFFTLRKDCEYEDFNIQNVYDYQYSKNNCDQLEDYLNQEY